MMGFQRLICLATLLLSLSCSTQAYTSRMEDRGYNSDPYARDDGVKQARGDIPQEYYDEVDSREKLTDPPREEHYKEDSRMEGRAYSNGPVEDNVSGVDCMLQDNSFGDIDGTLQSTPIEFNYQLECTPNSQANTRDILDSLEKSILENVLSTLFADMCGRRRVRYVRRRLQVEIVGASTYPEDQELESKFSVFIE